jgi:hypothetical protein
MRTVRAGTDAGCEAAGPLKQVQIRDLAAYLADATKA